MGNWQDDILRFWFSELTPQDWYSGGDAVDAKISGRFAALWQEQHGRPAGDFLTAPGDALAAIILFDQFPRNMFRGDARAFSSDPLARAVTHGALERQWDVVLDASHKQFLYMPLMHSEQLSDQELCVDLFRALGNENSLKFAVEHRDTVARFGRFPHRNAVLGRASTPEEDAFLETANRYGQ